MVSFQPVHLSTHLPPPLPSSNKTNVLFLNRVYYYFNQFIAVAVLDAVLAVINILILVIGYRDLGAVPYIGAIGIIIFGVSRIIPCSFVILRILYVNRKAVL